MAQGLLVMNNTTTGLAGGPGDVHTSSDGASALIKTKLQTPTSEKEENQRNKPRPVKEVRRPDLTIPKNEEEKLKQPSLK